MGQNTASIVVEREVKRKLQAIGLLRTQSPLRWLSLSPGSGPFSHAATRGYSRSSYQVCNQDSASKEGDSHYKESSRRYRVFPYVRKNELIPNKVMQLKIKESLNNSFKY